MKRKILWYIVLVLAVTFMQHKLTPLIEIAGVQPNFYLILTVAVAVIFGQFDGATIGCVTGIMFDFHSALPFGTYALLGFFTGLLAGVVHYSEIKNTFVLQLATVAVATLCYELVTFTVAASSNSENWLSGMALIFENYWHAISSVIWIEVIYNVVLSVLFYFFVGYVVRPRDKDDVVKSYTVQD